MAQHFCQAGEQMVGEQQLRLLFLCSNKGGEAGELGDLSSLCCAPTVTGIWVQGSQTLRTWSLWQVSSRFSLTLCRCLPACREGEWATVRLLMAFCCSILPYPSL